MVSYQQAVEIILSRVAPLDPVRLPLERCVGLTLARAVSAKAKDRRKGRAVLAAGVRLTPVRLAAAAKAGTTKLWVHPRPKTGVFAKNQGPGGFSGRLSGAGLADAVERFGCDLATDNEISSLDFTIGLAGRHDLPALIEATAAEGKEVSFDRVAIEPGGDVAFVASPPGLDGPGENVLIMRDDPVSVMLAWLLFGRLVAGRLMGRPVLGPRRILALTSAAAPAGDETLTRLAPAVLTADEKFTGWRVAPVCGAKSSYDIFDWALANALIVRAAGAGPLPAGAACEVLELEGFDDGMM